jgi:hypothetical protein
LAMVSNQSLKPTKAIRTDYKTTGSSSSTA